MRALDDNGKELDAEYFVERDGDYLALILNSRSGSSGGRNARNTEYASALEAILYRLWIRNATLVDGLVDTRATQRADKPDDERRFINAPIRLDAEGSHQRALRVIMTGQQSVALESGSSGAGRRIRLRVAVPGYGLEDRERLEHDLRIGTPDIFYRSADEPDIELGQDFPEGAVTKVTVNRYERDPQARKACLKRYGHRCQACGLDFGERYGELGEGFIHVHHIKELSTVGPGYRVDPIDDLRPVCPNCHAMVHQVTPAMPIEELRDRIRHLHS